MEIECYNILPTRTLHCSRHCDKWACKFTQLFHIIKSRGNNQGHGQKILCASSIITINALSYIDESYHLTLRNCHCLIIFVYVIQQMAVDY